MKQNKVTFMGKAMNEDFTFENLQLERQQVLQANKELDVEIKELIKAIDLEAQKIIMVNTILDLVENLIFHFVLYPFHNAVFKDFRKKMLLLESDINWEVESSYLPCILWIFPNSLVLRPDGVSVIIGYHEFLRKSYRDYHQEIDYDRVMREKYGNILC